MMDTIKKMVCQNAGINEQQALKSIEAVMAYIINEIPGPIGEMVNTKVMTSNADTSGALTGDSILEHYITKYGSASKPS